MSFSISLSEPGSSRCNDSTPLPPCLPHHDGLYPPTARQSNPFLPQAAFARYFITANRQTTRKEPSPCLRHGPSIAFLLWLNQRRWETPMKFFWTPGLIELPQRPPWKHGAVQGGSSSPLKDLEGQITASEASSGRASCTLCFPGLSLLTHRQKYQNTVSTASG